MKTYLILFLAIVFETVATSFLKQSEQFTKLVPSVLTVLGYAAAFYCLSVVLKSIPVGIAYAIWSGVGIILIALIGFFVFKQHLDLAAIIGLVLIIAGVVVINVFSTRSLIDGSVPSLCSIPNEKKEIMFFISMVSFFFSIIGRSQIYTFNIRYKYAFSSLLL